MTKFEFAGIFVGMSADGAVRLLKTRPVKAIKTGWTKQTEHGLLTLWLFDDGTEIVLDRIGKNMPYTITEINYGKYTYDEIMALDLKTELPGYEEKQPKKKRKRKARPGSTGG